MELYVLHQGYNPSIASESKEHRARAHPQAMKLAKPKLESLERQENMHKNMEKAILDRVETLQTGS